MPPVSDGTVVPGNAALTELNRAARLADIHEPYQQAIAQTLAARDAMGQESVLISLHSFTPALRNGSPRPWQIGVLHGGGDASFATALLTSLRHDSTLTVGDNEPYRMDGIDHTVPRHAYPDRPYVELEVRQDLLGDAAGVAAWAERLAVVLAD